MCIEKNSSESGIYDLLDDEVNDMQKIDVEENFWGDDPDRYVDYDTTDYTFVDTNSRSIEDLIDDEMYVLQAQDVEVNFWGDASDDDPPTGYDGRPEKTMGW